jgi:YidC/Oxa1 family membrane protein insertase
MDRKSIGVLVACFVLMMLWAPLVNWIYPPVPAPGGTNRVAVATNRVGGATNLLAAAPADTNRNAVITNPSAPTAAWVKPTAEEQLVTVENADAIYTFTSHGGGLKKVELKAYPDTVGCRRKGVTNQTELATLNDDARVPALALFAGTALDGHLPFSVTKTAAGARVDKVLENGIRLSKEFVPGTNFVLTATVRVENISSNPVALPEQELVVGTATPINRRDNGQFIGLQYFDGKNATFISDPWFQNSTLGCGLLPSTPRAEYRHAPEGGVAWAAVHNQFFAMIGAPRENAVQVVSRKIDLPGPTKEQKAKDPKVVDRPFGFETALVYPGLVLAPGQKVERVVEVFAGPKEYYTLAKLSKSQDQAMNFGKYFGWFAKTLLLSMNGLHRLGLEYGLAIIGITVIIKLLFWPLTQASTRSMKRMQQLQPQMKALQDKYKDDPKKMNAKLMEFMKENKVNPMGGCLPILIQIPVFIGFYQMLQSAIELRGASFLWACDLSQPDTVLTILGFPVNPLPLIMGVTQFWQARMTPPSPGMDPMQQKIMQYMPLMFIVILYNFPAGLALYWTVQNLLSILQMKLVKTTTGPAPAPAARKK